MAQRAAIMVHGGAGRIPAELAESCRKGCRGAALIGWDVLMSGGSALDAVEQAVRVLEDDPVFDAGVGSHLNRAGQAELDAALMDGSTLRVGAVVSVRRVRNPIVLARRILEADEHVMYSGEGAEAFALEQGLALCRNEDLIIPRERDLWEAFRSGKRTLTSPDRRGTVGAVAVDREGRIAAGNSTGGTPFKRPGRIGDTALIGCGTYADQMGGVALTGHGESVIKLALGKSAVDWLRERRPAEVARAAVELLEHRLGGRGGLVIADRHGDLGWAFNTAHMAYAYMHDGVSEPVVGL